MPNTLYKILDNSALTYPDNVAVIEADTGISITYGELKKRVDSGAAFIAEHGMNPGDKMGVLSRNSIDSISAIFSTLRAGCIILPLNHTLRPKDITYQTNDCSVKGLYFDGYNLERADNVVENTSSIELKFYEKDLAGAENLDSSAEVAAEPTDLAAVVYTSGTTRIPLGVMLSHQNLIANNAAIAKYLDLNSASSVCCVLPLYYIYGLSLLFSHFLVGGTLVLDNRFTYPNAVLDTLEKYKIRGFAGVSSHFAMLLDRSDIRNRVLPDLEYFTQAGDSMPEPVTREIIELFPHKKLYIMYGQTEAAPRLTYLEPSKVKTKPRSIGQAVPGVKIRIIDDRGEECPPLVEGEITAKGDNIMLGYLGNPEETANVLKDGWLHTGDMAYKDEDGDIFIVGREKNFVKIGANRVNPLEIEHFVLDNDNIMEAAAVGISDEVLGCRIKLFVVPKSGSSLNSDEIMAKCKENLPTYKVPSEIEIVDTLPRTDSGKIDKERLEKME